MKNAKRKLRNGAAILMALALVMTSVMFMPMTAQAKNVGLETILNSITVGEPEWSGCDQVDVLLQSVLAQTVTAEMTTYQKVKACYDWLITNCSYGGKGTVLYVPSSWTGTMYDYVVYDFLVQHVGVCDSYNTTFVYLMRALGITESWTISGQTKTVSGTWTPHLWSVIVVNGVDYVFDAQVEDNIANRNGGAIGYYRFGKTYSELPGKFLYEDGTTPEESVVQVYTSQACSVYSKPVASTANSVLNLDAMCGVQIYPTVIASQAGDGQYFYQIAGGGYILCNQVTDEYHYWLMAYGLQ